MLQQVHYNALIDTLNNVSIQTQAGYRKVSGSSQSSILRTAINKLKVYAKHNAPNIYDSIKNVKTYYQLRNIPNKDSVRELIDLCKIEHNYIKPKQKSRVIAKSKMPDFVELKPIVTVMKSDNYEQALQIAKELEHSLNAYDGAMLMFNTMINQFNFTPKSSDNER